MNGAHQPCMSCVSCQHAGTLFIINLFICLLAFDSERIEWAELLSLLTANSSFTVGSHVVCCYGEIMLFHESFLRSFNALVVATKALSSLGEFLMSLPYAKCLRLKLFQLKPVRKSSGGAFLVRSLT